MTLPARILRALFLGLLLLLLLFVSAATAEPQKQWATLITGVSASGIPVETQVFGYYADVEGYGQVFVICDPATGNETGYVYIPGAKVGEAKKQRLTGYRWGWIEDWNVVKRIDPVEIKLTAPNVYTSLTYTDYSWQQYGQTGQLKKVATSLAKWPGTTEGYMIPGADPDYWLIVADVYNPNRWPVKVKISVEIERWRDSGLSGGVFPVSKDKELLLTGGERKFILVNRGASYYLLASKRNSDGQAWTVAYFSSDVTENRDPELPDYLKPNKGFIKFRPGTPPMPEDLSGGIPIAYYVRCGPDSGFIWYFEGTVRIVPNEWGEAIWTAYPGSQSKNPQVAKQMVEKFFQSHWPQIYPISSNYKGVVIDGIKFYECTNRGAKLSSDPYKTWYDGSGPALASYTTPIYDIELDVAAKEIVSGNEIPVLKYSPIFVEFCRFKPTTTSPDEGTILKEIVPGYYVRASSVGRPYFYFTDTLNNYTIYHSNGKWVVTLNHHVTIYARNPDYKTSVTFSNISLTLPNIHQAVIKFEDYLETSLDADVDVYKPNYRSYSYRPALVYFNALSLNPGEMKTVYNANVITEIQIDDTAISHDYDPWGDQYLPDYYVPIGRSDVESAVNSVLSYFNRGGEVAFVRSTGRISFYSGQVLSLNQACVRDGDVYRDVGLVDSREWDLSKWLRPLSYFEKGQSMRPSDGLWVELQGAKVLSGPITSRSGKNFWPIMEYRSKSGWYLVNKIDS